LCTGTFLSFVPDSDSDSDPDPNPDPDPAAIGPLPPLVLHWQGAAAGVWDGRLLFLLPFSSLSW